MFSSNYRQNRHGAQGRAVFYPAHMTVACWGVVRADGWLANREGRRVSWETRSRPVVPDLDSIRTRDGPARR